MDTTDTVGRFTVTLLGFAVGDALGMPAQFLTRNQIRRYYGRPISGFLKAHTGHASDFLNQGSFTDDTQMMLATAECLIECGKMDPARQADALLSWYSNAMPLRTPMRANVRACRHLAAGRSWSKSGVFSSGCGAAVRMPPIGLFFLHQPESLARAAVDDCVITHNEPRARAASVAVAYLVARLVKSTDRCSLCAAPQMSMNWPSHSARQVPPQGAGARRSGPGPRTRHRRRPSASRPWRKPESEPTTSTGPRSRGPRVYQHQSGMGEWLRPGEWRPVVRPLRSQSVAESKLTRSPSSGCRPSQRCLAGPFTRI